jgi:hypothetical protein
MKQYNIKILIILCYNHDSHVNFNLLITSKKIKNFVKNQKKIFENFS